MQIIARNRECETLERVYSSSQSEFVAVHGRRRVGKTYLIRNFFLSKDCAYFELTGQKKENGEAASVDHQIGNFMHAWQKAFSEEIEKPDSWDRAFYLLKIKVEQLCATGRPVVLFFDELPWLCTTNSRFYENLDQAWNASFEPALRVKLIACGSASTWMLKKIVYAKAGLSRRVTHKLSLAPFTLSETRDYLKFKKFNLTSESVAELYMIMGGIPYYLNCLLPEKSIDENIDDLLFNRGSLLYGEYDVIFDSLFANARTYKSVIEILSGKRQGYTLSEIQKKYNPKAGSLESTLVLILENLLECGFINKRVPLYNKKRGVVYALTDEYILFYFKWIKDRSLSGGNSAIFRQTIMQSPSYHSWQGFSFELLCLKHITAVKKALGIDKIAAESGFFYAYDNKSGRRTAQIDILFDRADKTITICELKHYHAVYEITKKDLDSVINKKDALVRHLVTKRRPMKNIHYAFITLNGVIKNACFNQLRPVVITLEDLFTNDT
jgi:AAA+ ATPase superfamily predicted ATPase